MQQCLFAGFCGLWAAAQLHPTVGAVEARDREGWKGGRWYHRHHTWQLDLVTRGTSYSTSPVINRPPLDKSVELD